MRKANFQIEDLINDYVNEGIGMEPLCAKYHTGKNTIREILKVYGIETKKRGGQRIEETYVVDDYRTPKYVQKEGYHFEVYDEKTDFETIDLDNKSGVLTTYIEKEYGVETPSLFHRQRYYMRTGNYWWEQWLKVREVENPKVKKCPYCDWETIDVDNKSGMFGIHLMHAHGMTTTDYLKEFPNDKAYFEYASPTLNRQTETDENKFVTCQVCGRKFARITEVHLKKHGLTKAEYMQKYGVSGTTSNVLHERMKQHAILQNTYMERDFSSQEEKEIKAYVESLGFECASNRQILHGRELDIYIPSKQIAIEYNGNLWHSEKFKKDRTYHLNKLVECNKQGIKLIQVFEDEYAEHRDIVLSKIKHILGCEDGEVFQGRKCVVETIPSHDAEEFLNQYHIQGFVNATVYYGAIRKTDGKLVAVMSFLNEGNGNWNLMRFASINGSKCQGIASKLFTHFVRENNPLTVRSFADRRWTLDANNNVYTKLGFKLDTVLSPEYRYYNPKVDRYKRFHKFGFRKDKLHKLYGLPLSMTEKEMMQELGYTRIWDCGLFKYVWEKKEGEE